MKKRVHSLLVALCFVLGLVACAKAPTWQEQYDLGVRYLSEGNYQEAIIAFTEAIRIDPKQENAYIGLTDAYIGAGDYTNAETTIQKGREECGDLNVFERLLDRLSALKTGEGESGENQMEMDGPIEPDDSSLQRYDRAIQYVIENGIMSGPDAADFRYQDPLTRAMVLQIFYNIEGRPAVSGKHTFTDVPSVQWFNNAVTWGTSNGVLGGYGNGKFAPNDGVTLEQIAVILWNYSGNPKFTGTADSVGAHSSWAANALAWAVENGILENIPTEDVTVNATNAQGAQIFMNFLER